MPGVATAPLLSASLALRLLTITTEIMAFVGNRVARTSPPAPTMQATVAINDVAAVDAPDRDPGTPGTLEA